MKERNLKDRLNEIPQPFDREALWERIAAEKPKKRRPLLWFWLLPVVFILSMIGLMWRAEETPKLTTGEQIMNSQTAEAVIEKKETNNSKVSKAENRELLTTAIQYTAGLRGGEVITTEKKGQQIGLTGIQSSSRKEVTRSTEIRDANISNRNNKTITDAQSSFPFANNTSIDLPAKTGFGSQSSRSSLVGALSPTVSKFLILPVLKSREYQFATDQREVSNLSSVRIIKAVSNPASRWFATIGAHYGMENHSFTERRNVVGSETELEALGLGFTIDREFGNWLIGLGVKHTIGSTFLDYNSSRFRHLQGINGVTGESISTIYNLYNSYQRTDVSLGVSYGLAIGRKLDIRPRVAIGTNVYSAVQGDYFSADGVLTSLREYQDGIGMYGAVGLDVHYYISDVLSLQIGLSMESQRKYNKAHKINPMHARIGISRVW